MLSYIDHTPGVDGLGVAKLRAAGIEVQLNVLAAEGKRLSAARNTFVKLGRPYVILKFAMSQDGFIAPDDQRQLWLTNAYSKRLVHKWRSEVDAILVGTNTAAWDNPKLTNRLYFGSSPTRLVVDRKLRLPKSLSLFDGSVPTYVYTHQPTPVSSQRPIHFVNLTKEKNLAKQILGHLGQIKKISLMVEGGAALLREFLDQDLWDEIRLFQAPILLSKGIKAPQIPTAYDRKVHRLIEDQLSIIYRDRQLASSQA